MSYSICRVAKVKASGVTGIQIHDKREKDGISHTNKDIDWTKTEQNVSLVEQDERFKTAVSNRISQLNLKRQPRSDATVMCQFLITSDNAFFDKMSRQEQTDFFKKSLYFIAERYGNENIISATIHNDERTPHMHVNFVPVTDDGRLSAKDLFSPKSLRVLQNDYNRFVRENGYDLERGEIDSKTKHLEVEKYKIETKYEQLKDKEKKLAELEKVDTKVGLQADKGRLTYSTKEVDAIKEQNTALKLENHKKDNTIAKLEYDLAKTSKTLTQAQKRVEGMEIQTDRLKDLESENNALNFLRQKHPQFNSAFTSFDKMRQTSYALGEKLAECKEHYHQCSDERKHLIERSYHCENMVKECDKQIQDVSKLKNDISHSLAQETALKAEIEGLKGIFKKKAREDCQAKLKAQEEVTGRLQERLRSEHCTDFEHIPIKIQEYASQKDNFLADKKRFMEQTNEQESNMDKAVHLYKYHKGLADVQQTDFKDITDRIDKKVALRPGEEKLFRITQADRSELLKLYVDRVEPRTIERVKEHFEQQTVQEQQQRQTAKTPHKSKTHDRGRDR